MKGKYDGAESQPAGLLEELLGETGQDALEVREVDVLVEHEALDLVEHRRVRHVGIAAIDRPGAISRIGTPCSFMARICTGEVWVLSRRPSPK